MKFFIYQNNFPLKFIFLFFIFFSCLDPDRIPPDNPISNPEFTFMQDQNKVYFSANFQEEYQGEALDSTFVRWYSSSLALGFDAVALNDDGVNGDIIEGDKIFARKISNESLNRAITDADTGFLFAEFTAIYGGRNYVGLLDSGKVGNLIPKIINVIADTLISRPEGRNINLIKVKAEVLDGDGNESIKWVGFTSFSLRDLSLIHI